MNPSRGQVKARFQSMLDDPSGQVFTEAVFAPAFGEAWDALYNGFAQFQVPAIDLIAYFTLPAYAPQVTPADMGFSDFSDFESVWERTAGTTGKFRQLNPVVMLPQRNEPGDHLGVFVWRNDTFYFNPSRNSIQLEIGYRTSGAAPTADATIIRVDNALTFLSNYAAGIAGMRKGYNEIAAQYMTRAVGQRYDAGSTGGELFRLIQTRVRTMQKIPLAQPRFSASRRFPRTHAIPYVEAQPGTTS